MDSGYYGDVEEAAAYFGCRLHADAWSDAAVADRPKALAAATQIIDALSFKGSKATVYALSGTATAAEVRAAESAQVREFPRDGDTEVPEPIRRACYEIAYALLDGRDPEMELETFAVSSRRIGPLQTDYERNQAPLEHLINGVPSTIAWRLLVPFLRDSHEIVLKRVS